MLATVLPLNGQEACRSCSMFVAIAKQKKPFDGQVDVSNAHKCPA